MTDAGAPPDQRPSSTATESPPDGCACVAPPDAGPPGAQDAGVPTDAGRPLPAVPSPDAGPPPGWTPIDGGAPSSVPLNQIYRMEARQQLGLIVPEPDITKSGFDDWVDHNPVPVDLDLSDVEYVPIVRSPFDYTDWINYHPTGD